MAGRALPVSAIKQRSIKGFGLADMKTSPVVGVGPCLSVSVPHLIWSSHARESRSKAYCLQQTFHS